MADFSRFQEPVWDRFFDYIGDDLVDLTDEQLDEELRRRNIDVTRAFARLQQSIQSAKARVDLEAARKSRPGLLRQLKGLTVPTIGTPIEELRQILARKAGGRLQPAFFRRLESAATEDDLRSLLEDIHRLNALEEGPGDAGTQTE